MTNILVCVKRAPDPTGEVVLTDDGLRVDGRYAGYTTSAHEEALPAGLIPIVLDEEQVSAGPASIGLDVAAGDDAWVITSLDDGGAPEAWVVDHGAAVAAVPLVAALMDAAPTFANTPHAPARKKSRRWNFVSCGGVIHPSSPVRHRSISSVYQYPPREQQRVA